MTKVIRRDLSNMSSCTQNSLDAVDNAIENVINSLNSFVNDTKDSLKGDAWDAIRKKVNTYSSILKSLRAKSYFLKVHTVDANNKMDAYVSPYTVIDTSEKEKIESNITFFQTQLNNVVATLRNLLSQSKNLGDFASSIGRCYSSIANYQKLIETNEKLLEKINGLEEMDSSLCGFIEIFNGQNQEISNNIFSIPISKI